MDIQIKPCTLADLTRLHDLSCQTFEQTFGDQNTPSDLQAYLDQAFDVARLRAQLTNPHSQFYFLFAGGQLAGYLKLNDAPAQTELHDSTSLEIERIYLLQAFQGRGLGGRMINQAIATAQAYKKQYIWLGVWEKNEKALSFYKKHGFLPFGEHSFFVGDDKQTDFLLRKDL